MTTTNNQIIGKVVKCLKCFEQIKVAAPPPIVQSPAPQQDDAWDEVWDEINNPQPKKELPPTPQAPPPIRIENRKCEVVAYVGYMDIEIFGLLSSRSKRVDFASVTAVECSNSQLRIVSNHDGQISSVEIPVDESDAQTLRGRIIKSKPELREERDIVVEFTGKCEEILAVLTCDGSEIAKLKWSAKELEFLGRELSIAERMFLDRSLNEQSTKAAASGLLFSLIATAAGGDAGRASLNNDIATSSSMRDFQQRVSSVFGQVRAQIEKGQIDIDRKIAQIELGI